MKRIIIFVEGQTEEEFVKSSIRPYLQEKGIYEVSAIKVRTSKAQKGGFVNYQHLKNDIKKVLHEPNLIVTTFVDFFRIPTSVPGYDQLGILSNVDDKIDVLEKGIATDINHAGFIPYIQKFEFEALLFSSNAGFIEMYDKGSIHVAIDQVIEQYPNPEEINDNPHTSPSNRIKSILKENGERYDKVVDGNLIAGEIGMETILGKCPRFQSWIERLVMAANEN